MTRALRLLAAAAALTLAAGPTRAQEVLTAPAGAKAPAAAIGDAAWLTGRWVGKGIEGARAEEAYLPAAGGAMVGVFRQETLAGCAMFLELVSLEERDGSLVYRLKHFDPDLRGWEGQGAETARSFPLVRKTADALYFDGLTYARDGTDGLKAAVRVKGKDGTSEVLVFTYTRAR